MVDKVNIKVQSQTHELLTTELMISRIRHTDEENCKRKGIQSIHCLRNINVKDVCR